MNIMKDLDLFSSNIHWKVLRYLCLKGNRELLNVTSIARNIEASKAMTSIALNELHYNGYVKRIEISNSHIYSLTEGPLIDLIKRTIGLSMIMGSNLIEDLIDMDPDIISISLYGSFARGDFDEESDIDVFVISSSNMSRRLLDTRSIEGFSVNIITFTPGSFDMLKKKDRPFYDQVMKDHIRLYGSG